MARTELSGNKRDYFPRSVFDMVLEKKVVKAVERLDGHKQDVLAQLKIPLIPKAAPLNEKQTEVLKELEKETLEPKKIIKIESKETRFKKAYDFEQKAFVALLLEDEST